MLSSSRKKPGRSRSRATVLGIAAIVYAGAIFLLSAQSSIPGTPMGLFPGFDKAAHFLEFAVLGALLFLSFAAAGWRPWDIPLSIALGVIYGIVDEFHQMFVQGRTTDILDAVADAAGVLVAVAVLAYVDRRARRASESRASVAGRLAQ